MILRISADGHELPSYALLIRRTILRPNNPLLDNGVLKHASRQRTRLEESKRFPRLTHVSWQRMKQRITEELYDMVTYIRAAWKS
jgi:hypothetical protein